MNAADLVTCALAVLPNAYAPYSRFRVAAALLTADGRVFTGTNVENASYGLTLCAERVAAGAAVAAGSREFAAVAVVADGDAAATPCGACRQVLAEFGGPDMAVHLASAKTPERVRSFRLAALLPEAFSLPPRG